MIDIFMESLLGALVQFGGVIAIEPGIGAMAFCGVVVLTMFAAETFDPRIIWDAAEESVDRAVAPSGMAYTVSAARSRDTPLMACSPRGCPVFAENA
jgi:hypothetical protein